MAREVEFYVAIVLSIVYGICACLTCLACTFYNTICYGMEPNPDENPEFGMRNGIYYFCLCSCLTIAPSIVLMLVLLNDANMTIFIIAACIGPIGIFIGIAIWIILHKKWDDYEDKELASVVIPNLKYPRIFCPCLEYNEYPYSNSS